MSTKTAKHARSVAAFLCAAAPAASAESVTVQWNSQYTSHDTVLVWADLTIDPGADFYGFAGSIFDVVGTDDAFTQVINYDESRGLGRLFQYQGASAGTLDGDDILQIDQFQLPEILNGDFNSSTTIDRFFSFEYIITDFTDRTVSFTSNHMTMDMYTNSFGSNTSYSVNVFGTSFDVAIVPLPSVAGMAGLGIGLLGVSWRRRHASEWHT